MASYEEIHGKRVETFSSDPTLDSSYEGQVWFNSTSGTLKTVVASAAWSSSTPMTSARAYLGGTGTQTAGLACGGFLPPHTNKTEEYNGSGWANSGNLNVTRGFNAACGPQTAALTFGGETPSVPAEDATEEYDGSSWTNGGNLNEGNYGIFGAGTQTAAVAAGGASDSPPTSKSTVAEYNGSSWTNVTSMPTAFSYATGFGLQTAANMVGGTSTSTRNLEYDGTNWTTGGSLNTGRQALASSGITTAGLVFGGTEPSLSAKTETYDGTSFTETADLATARGGVGAAMVSPNTQSLAFGGVTPPYVGATEEFNVSINTVTAAAWASGATYPLSLNQLGGSGTQTAGLCFGGNLPPGNPNGSNQTKEYDGSAWTAGGNLNIGKDTGSRSGVGTQTASMAINFRNDGSPPVSPVNYIAMTNVEEYNGSSWTAGTATPDGEVEAGTCGTISAALRFGGNPGNPPGGPFANSTIYWNDTSWASLNNMSTARSGLAPAFQGTYNAALGFGGETATPTEQTATEEFDGTNWTSGGNLNTAVSRHSGSGTQTAALAFGGTPSVTRTEGYDGTTWSTRPSLANGRKFGGGAGSSTAALYMCGDGTTHVEEFTGETLTVNAKTLTTS